MNKKALSNIIAYVMLIVITISLSVMVYGWLSFYFSESEIGECGDSVNVVVDSYECVGGDSGSLSVAIKNKGMFSVDGYTLRVHNRTNAEFGIYTWNETGVLLAPGERVDDVYEFSDWGVNRVTLVEVQPFLMEGDKLSCRSSIVVKVSC